MTRQEPVIVAVDVIFGDAVGEIAHHAAEPEIARDPDCELVVDDRARQYRRDLAGADLADDPRALGLPQS